MIKKLICSYSFWTALAGALGLLGSAIGRAFSFKLEEKIISDVVMAIAGVLVVVGIVKVPTNDEEKSDEKPEEKDENSDKKEQ